MEQSTLWVLGTDPTDPDLTLIGGSGIRWNQSFDHDLPAIDRSLDVIKGYLPISRIEAVGIDN